MAQAYRKVRAPQDRPSDPNEVRISNKKPLGNYAKYVLSQFREHNATEVTLRQMGKQLGTIVSVAEIVKYRVKGLYQVNRIETQVFEEVYEPLEEGLDTLRFKRVEYFFTITLSKNEPKEKGVGYQEPIDEKLVDESQPVPHAPQREGGRRNGGGKGGEGRGRGGRRGGAGAATPEGGEKRAAKPEGERTERRERKPREEGDRKPREEGDRKPREDGENGGERRFRGSRGGARGGRGGPRPPREGAELVPGEDGRVEVRTRGFDGERGGRGGNRGGERGGFRGGRGGERGGRPAYGDKPAGDRPPRTEGAPINQPRGERRGGNRGGDRGGDRGAPRGGSAAGPRATRGAAPQ